MDSDSVLKASANVAIDGILYIEKKMKIALYLYQREIHNVASRAALRALLSHPKDNHQKLIYDGHTSQY